MKKWMPINTMLVKVNRLEPTMSLLEDATPNHNRQKTHFDGKENKGPRTLTSSDHGGHRQLQTFIMPLTHARKAGWEDDLIP